MPPSRQRLVLIAKTATTVLIIGVSAYFFVRNVDFGELKESFRSADYVVALSIIPLILLSHYVRAHRWKVMLAYIHPGVGTWNLFVGVMLGYFMNNIIPRSGELVRPYVTADRERAAGATFSSLFGTIVIERFIDTVALLAVIAIVLVFDTALFSGIAGFEDAVRGLLYPMIILGVLFLFVAPSALGHRIADLFTRPFPERFRERVMDIFTKLQTGFRAIRTLRQATIVIADTIVINFLYMVPLYVMFFAVRSGPTLHPTLFHAVEVYAITALAYAVAPTPGAFGVFHITARVATMRLLHFSEADAVAYATIMHFINYTTVMIVGAVFIFLFNLSTKSLLGKNRSTSE
ncbi:MAG: lysylphosphatidylglycerol synthase transmembrane domain-containing protein [Bacteroidota bacterium]|nr:lysylphosphatidylglycerol synthase transmembrane domain-containing protein [Bacteroidota bacterium]